MTGRNWGRAWRADVGPAVNEIVTEAQRTSALTADDYIASVLSELDIPADVPTTSNVDALVGVAGDGTPVESLTYGAVTTAAKAMYTPEAEAVDLKTAAARALAEAEDWLQATVATILADTARGAERVSTAQRPWVRGYVRMVEPGACSRCIILAGKYYRYNGGFLRHPRCHCRHIPASEGLAGDMATDSSAYFDGLTRIEQDRVFTAAGAASIRLGADPAQVVNARRGMQTAQVYGRSALITTEGTTARGLAGKSLGDLQKVAGQRYRQSGVPRLMPETILAEASSPEDALRLLKRFGYVL